MDAQVSALLSGDITLEEYQTTVCTEANRAFGQ
jgi:hypothetical protein